MKKNLAQIQMDRDFSINKLISCGAVCVCVGGGGIPGVDDEVLLKLVDHGRPLHSLTKCYFLCFLQPSKVPMDRSNDSLLFQVEGSRLPRETQPVQISPL